MGSGKSTLGRRLARFMQYSFFDLDQEIVRAEGCSIRELFDLRGEEGFRQIERKHLEKLMDGEDMVISLGGGTACIPEVMDDLLKQSVVVYLKMSEDGLVSRLRSSPVERPLLAGMDEQEMQDFIRKKLGEREAVYRRAHVSVDAEHPNLPLIMKALEKYARES